MTSKKPVRQFCRKGIHDCIPAVTLTFGPGRRLHWCAEHADDAERYRADQALHSTPHPPEVPVRQPITAPIAGVGLAVLDDIVRDGGVVRFHEDGTRSVQWTSPELEQRRLRELLAEIATG